MRLCRAAVIGERTEAGIAHAQLILVGRDREGEGGARAGLIEQEHLSVARDRHRHRGEHRAGIGDEKIDLVLRDQLIVERRGRRRVALVVVGDELDRQLLVIGFDIHAAFGVLLVDPQLEPVMHGHGNRGITARRRIERSDLDLGWCFLRLQRCGQLFDGRVSKECGQRQLLVKNLLNALNQANG